MTPRSKTTWWGAWLSLPRRIYLDTSTLQNLYDFGGEIFEGEPFEPVGRAARVRGLADEIDALRMIFTVNERAMSGHGRGGRRRAAENGGRPASAFRRRPSSIHCGISAGSAPASRYSCAI